MLIDFKDAVTGANLDPTQTHAVYYMDGHFANRAAVAARCPHAKLYGITVTGLTGKDVFALDSENGDIDTGCKGVFPKTEAWVAEQVRLGVSPIVVYANQDRWVNLGLLARLAHYGDRIERWDADYDGVAELPSWASAKQYADPGPVDLNVALANFFGDAPDPHYERFDNTPRLVLKKLRRERGQVELYDKWRAMQTKTKHPHRAALAFNRCVLGWYAGRVWAVAHIKRVNGKPSWDVDYRLWRFQQLVKRGTYGQRVV